VGEEEHETIEDYFERQLRELSYSPEADAVFIPSQVACDWCNAAMRVSQSTTATSRMLGQAIDEKKLWQIQRNLCNTYGRGFVWRGKDSTAGDNIRTDLPDRIEDRKRKARAGMP
jgi:hypothetical protein